MRQFFRRLDRLVDAMIDTDLLLGPDARLGPVPLKVIFDNLRYYTVLGLLSVGIKLLIAEPGWGAKIALVVLVMFTGVLSVLVALQTSLVVLTATFGAVGSLMHPRHAVELRRRVRSKSRFRWYVLLPFALFILAAVGLTFLAVGRALLRSGGL